MAVDYAALADQARKVDYDALEKQAKDEGQTTAAAPSAGTWEQRGRAGAVWHPAVKPTADRADTSAVGFNHTAVQQRISDWASKLPRHLQRPAAEIAAFPADVLGSLVEMFSAPETIATAGAKPALAAMDAVPGMAKTAVTGAAKGTVKAVGALADTVSPEVVGVVSPRAGHVLRVIQKMRDAAAKPPTAVGAAPRLATKPPTLTSSLETILDELHKESIKAPAGLETVEPGARATARGEEAATASMRLLKEKPTLLEQFGGTMSQDEAGKLMRAADMTNPKRIKVPASQVVATNEGFQNHLVDQYAVHPGEEIPSAILDPATGKYVLVDGHHKFLAQLANGKTQIELNTHPVDAALLKDPQPRAMWADQFLHKAPGAAAEEMPAVDLTAATSGGPSAAQARMMERTGRTTPYRSETANPPAPVPLSEAMSAVRTATKEAGVKPTALEMNELVKVVRTGRPASLTVDAFKIHQALKDSPSFAGLPTSAEADATIAAQEAASKARSTKPRYGSGQGDYGRQPAEDVTVSNPFR